ncbi:succinate semialdehyde dehydrogenase [Fulvimarina manganoxydans]|uniref:Succinate semialdehyde dehydrogenase n=1 Tax=Fulvimarina manganoxydans TaxID=937218 RepID=A0A1W2E3G0_9HYPH|nr:NAD-dependent succinate-semialdehyde dehydrogenase [Fulvimarina manganoxydans]MEE2953510.1 NAD-dependent succinate-semialdehyde dehydrogenase [Pseudomonadota bacterium]SMD03806.1 succinate semialdehyde dehydrogenase [Fulvimarina manganoxydans]
MSASAKTLRALRPFERLSDETLFVQAALINGQWRVSDETRPVVDPASEETIGSVPALGARETREAIDAASTALADWRAMLPQARTAILRRWHDLILAAREDLAIIMTREQGKPIAEARGEIDYAASFIAYYAEEAQRVTVESVTSHLPGASMSVSRVPVGVVGLVTPWNFPSAMLTRKAAAALAAGCTVVAHPSGETPFSALALGELAIRAGMPAGVLNIVTGDAPIIVGELCDDARVRAMSFTGSTEIGRLIAARSAATVKRLVLELGGHAPFIVFDDADVERAADIAVAAKFATSGQDCLAANRIFVQNGVYDRFVAAFARRIADMTLGGGFEANVDVGPLIHERAVEKVEAQVRDAVARGARCLVGGGRSALGPRFYAPTLLTDVPEDALIMREETFGPVAAVTRFATEGEVIARANDSEYGLCAYLVTRDGGRIARMTAALDYGMIAVNRVKITGAPVPFGGVKQSGLGREGSRHGLEAFTDLRYVCLDQG